LGEALPPIQFHHAAKAEVVGQVADTPGHDADLGMRQPAKRGFVKMVKMGVRQQHHINRREVFDLQTRPLDSFQQEKPVRKVGIDQDVKVGELEEKRGMANPGYGDLAEGQLGKGGALGLAGAPGQQRLPNHLAKEGARIEMLRRREILERSRERLTGLRRTIRGMFRHNSLSMLSILRFE
jgi:hypothetical protein